MSSFVNVYNASQYKTAYDFASNRIVKVQFSDTVRGNDFTDVPRFHCWQLNGDYVGLRRADTDLRHFTA